MNKESGRLRSSQRNLLLFILIISVALTGCQVIKIEPVIPETPVWQPELAPTPTTTPTSTPIYDGDSSLYLWWSQSPDDLMLLSDAWYDFRGLFIVGGNPQYPESTTLFSMEGYTDGATQLEQNIMAGTAPDVVRMDHYYLASLGQAGKILDLQAEFGAATQYEKAFFPSTWEASSYQNAVYGIPFDAYTTVFGGKTSALKAANVALPTTYDELRTVGAQIKEADLGEWVYTLPCMCDNYSSFVGVDSFMQWVWRLGGDILNEDMTQAVFQDPETGVRALEQMMQLQKDGLVPNVYIEGDTTFGDYGTWWLGGFREDMTFSLLPELKEGVPGYSCLGLYDLAVVSDTRNPQLAYDFVIHFATGKNSVTDEYYAASYAKAHNSIPGYQAAAESLKGTWRNETDAQFWEVSLQQLAFSKPRPTISCWPDIEVLLATAIAQTVSGEKTAEEALQEAANKTNRLLKE